ncbi:MAG: OmpA family protein [Desulfuromonadaceae bacterium]|nr:OmpA family protein [Desulfuromonadaceae bacterium]
MNLTTRTIRRFTQLPGTFAGGTGGLLSGVVGLFFTLLTRVVLSVTRDSFLWRRTLQLGLFFCLLPVALWAATPTGTHISNVATATFNGSITINSNQASVTTLPTPTPSTIEFLQYVANPTDATERVQINGTDLSSSGDLAGPFTPLPAPTPFGSATPISILTPTPLTTANVFHLGEPIFIRLTDLDQNIDTTLIDTVVVTLTTQLTGDQEVLRLYETGPDTGVFVAWLATTDITSSVPNNGSLSTVSGDSLTVTYRDENDVSDTSATAALVDPYGIVFDSNTGLPVNGATITIIDTGTGLPATIFGDDGISSYPSTLITGSGTTDSSGRAYTFPPGGYRYPFLTPGSYRFIVTPPAGYAVPSTTATAQLQSLPGAPFAVTPGSRGEVFVVNPGPALHIDIPADPVSVGLWLQKSAGKSTVASGDFIPYRVEVENKDPLIAATGMVITDRLPVGFRYQQGSTIIDGTAATDPTIATDGRTLSWNIGTLAAATKVTLRYVAAVGVNVKPGAAVNQVSATGDKGVTSNAATAAVTVREDLLRSKSFLVGRVLSGACSDDETALEGLAGVRIYLEDGSYVLTDDEGKYHFEGIEPGVHVVQLDLDSLPPTYEVLACDENSRFAGRAYSQFIDLQGGTLWRANFHVGLKPRIRGEATIALSSILEEDFVTFELPLAIASVPLTNLRLTALLPAGLAYVPGSSHLGTAPIDDPAIVGSSLTYRLGDRAAGWSETLTLRARLLDTAENDLTTRALLTFNTPEQENQRTPMVDNLLLINRTQNREALPTFVVRPQFPIFVAELSAADRAELDNLVERLRGYQIEKLYAIGHTDNLAIAPRSRHIFPDNFALSDARANNVARYLSEQLRLTPTQIVSVGMGDTMQIANNATAAGRARNRRVEIRIEGYRININTSVELIKEKSAPETVATRGMRPGEDVELPPQKTTDQSTKMPAYDSEWLATATAGIEWLWPQSTFYPAIPSIKAAVKHDPQQRVTFILNGKPVDPLNFDGTRRNLAKTVAVSRWNGVDIIDGDNRLRIEVSDSSGAIVYSEERIIHHSLPPVKAVLLPQESALIADGKTPPVLAVKLLDREGHPARTGNVGEFRVNPPYHAAEIHAEDRSLLSTGEKFRFQVEENGITRITLVPTSQSGTVEIAFPFIENNEPVTAWLQPAMRDWILVGLAEGTVGYNLVNDHIESAAAAGIDDKLYENNRLAFFAKGSIKGSWLLTMAYDSEKPDRKDRELEQTIDPDSYYTLYGDATTQGYEAASSEKLYLKIERNQFYALFGDYSTGLTTTELSRYSRSLTGLKAEWNTDNAQLNVFASDTGQVFVRDEIRGDGTSGLYRVSRTDLVVNSEKISIEVRDRFRSEQVLSKRELHRHSDYEIDYDDGTLFFKEPILSKDSDLNPIFIVVAYEARGNGQEYLNYGGRGAVKLLDKRIEVGASYIREKQGLGDGELIGTDVAVQLTDTMRLKAESARTDTSVAGTKESGSAHLIELQQESAALQSTLYLRDQETGFGLGQQNGSEDGMRKLGGDVVVKVTDNFDLSGQAFHQENHATAATRQVIEAETRYHQDNYTLSTGLREARDEFADGTANRSLQGTFGAGLTTLGNDLNLRVNHDQSLGGNDASADYPTRTTLGADYHLTKDVDLNATQEFTRGADEQTQGTHLGLSARPWTNGEIKSGVNQENNENGRRVFSTLGLAQRLQLTERWRLDGSVDHSKTIRDPGSQSVNINAPPASGTGTDFTALTFGLAYQLEHFSWTGRSEWRTSDVDDKWSISSGLVVEPRSGIALSNRFRYHHTDSTTGATNAALETRFGLAWRPTFSRWIILDRLDLVAERQNDGNFTLTNRRAINNLHLNVKPNRRTQLALRYGVKYVEETIDFRDYHGFTDLIGVEGRFDLTKRWDIGLHGSKLHGWNSGQIEYGLGASIGFSVMTNTWISAGYNVRGFEDPDFSKTGYTAQGPFVTFRIKFDQHSVKDAIAWLGHQ